MVGPPSSWSYETKGWAAGSTGDSPHIAFQGCFWSTPAPVNHSSGRNRQPGPPSVVMTDGRGVSVLSSRGEDGLHPGAALAGLIAIVLCRPWRWSDPERREYSALAAALGGLLLMTLH